jgi:hypothetical protein
MNPVKHLGCKGLAALSFVIIALGFTNVTSAGTFTPLTLPTLTEDIRTWTGGGAYDPLFPSSSQVLGGVPFSFQSAPNGDTAFYGGTAGNPMAGSLTIPVNIFGVSAVYTLINTAYGTPGSTVGSVTFNGSGGDSYTVALVEGVNVRDHYYGGFVNTTTDPSTTEAVFGVNSPGYAHLDMQTFMLPASFGSETLTDIIFNATGGFPNGNPFLAGATVQANGAVPDQTQFCELIALLALGVFGLCVRRRTLTAS